jgi:hypothetical protein
MSGTVPSPVEVWPSTNVIRNSDEFRYSIDVANFEKIQRPTVCDRSTARAAETIYGIAQSENE